MARAGAPRHCGSASAARREHCMKLAKLTDEADRPWPSSGARARDDLEKRGIEIYDRVNALGVGAHGLGGYRRARREDHGLAVPRRGKPVAMIPMRRHPPRPLRSTAPAGLSRAAQSDDYPRSTGSPMRRAARRPKQYRLGGRRYLKRGRPNTAERQDVDRARRGAQADQGHARTARSCRSISRGGRSLSGSVDPVMGGRRSRRPTTATRMTITDSFWGSASGE